MKIVTLLENTASRPDVIPQHGLSLYIETGERKILFDMGQDAAFACNAEKLGVDLTQVDLAVLSHGHYDHGGGLGEFLRINSMAPVYIHETAFGQYYNGTEKYIGLDLSLKGNARLIPVTGRLQIAPGILLADCNDLGWRSCSYGLNRKERGGFTPDTFSHEQYLWIREGEKQVLISGCSHKGILNIALHFAPDVLVGGFHLNKAEDMHELQEIGRVLLQTGTVFHTGHCTGQKQFAVLKEIMGKNLHPIGTGTVIEI